MQKKHIVSGLLILGIIASFGFYFANKSFHGDKDKWIADHKVVYYRLKKNNTQEKYCLNCHEKKSNQTKANFCNKCHAERGVKPVE